MRDAEAIEVFAAEDQAVNSATGRGFCSASGGDWRDQRVRENIRRVERLRGELDAVPRCHHSETVRDAGRNKHQVARLEAGRSPLADRQVFDFQLHLAGDEIEELIF